MKLSVQNIILIVATVTLVGCAGFIGYSLIGSKDNNKTPETTTTSTTRERKTTIKLEPEDTQVTEDFRIIMQTMFNGNQSYTVRSTTSEEEFIIKPDDYGLPSNLFDYTTDFLFRIKFDQITGKIYTVEVFNRLTQKIIDKPNERKIELAFNVEYNKKIIKKDWKQEIKLSELTENQVYSFITEVDVNEPPVIINDIGANVRVSTKGTIDDAYSKDFYFAEELKSNSVQIAIKNFKAGEAFNVSYKKVDTPIILALLDKSDIVYISEELTKEKFEHKFRDYIYNDTNENIIVTATDNKYGIENTKTLVLKPNDIIKFSWMIDTITFQKEGVE